MQTVSNGDILCDMSNPVFWKIRKYCIQPNYHIVHLGFSKILGKLVVQYVPTYTKGTLS